jgi:hypothetical protein
MQTVSIPTMKTMIAHTGIRKRRPLMFWGSFGVGKTEGVAQSAAENNAVLVDVRLSQYDSVDLRGFPGVDAVTNSTVWYPPATLPFKGNPRFNEDEGLIYLFLDEANAGAPSVLAVAYQLTNERRCGEHILMDNVIIILAGNREQDRGVTNRMPTPLLNRLVQAEVMCDVKSVSTYFTKKGVSPIGVAFLNWRPEYLHTYDPERPEKVNATPRTWEMALDDLDDPLMPDDAKMASMAGTIGESRVIELMAFRDIFSQLVPIEQIIANPDTVAVPEEMDRQYAMAVHVSGNMRADTADALQRYLDRLRPPMVVLAWTLAIARDPLVTETNAFLYQYAPKYRSLFEGA